MDSKRTTADGYKSTIWHRPIPPLRWLARLGVLIFSMDLGDALHALADSRDSRSPHIPGHYSALLSVWAAALLPWGAYAAMSGLIVKPGGELFRGESDLGLVALLAMFAGIGYSYLRGYNDDPLLRREAEGHRSKRDFAGWVRLVAIATFATLIAIRILR